MPEQIDDYLLAGKAVVVRDLGIFDYLQYNMKSEHMARNLVGVAENVEEAYLLCMDTMREERHNVPKAERKYLIFDGNKTRLLPGGIVMLAQPYRFSEDNIMRREIM